MIKLSLVSDFYNLKTMGFLNLSFEMWEHRNSCGFSSLWLHRSV